MLFFVSMAIGAPNVMLKRSAQGSSDFFGSILSSAQSSDFFGQIQKFAGQAINDWQAR